MLPCDLKHEPKKCRFHTDFALSWGEPDYPQHFLFCFGCDEIKYIYADEPDWFDMSDEAAETLQALLRKY